MFTPVRPKSADQVECKYVKANEECPFGTECHYNHVIKQPIINEQTKVYFLEPRTREQKIHTVLRRTLEENNWVKTSATKHQLKSTHIDMFWATCYPNHFVPKNAWINHYPNSYEVTDKSCLAANLPYDFVPLAFTLPKQLEEFSQTTDELWILKPCGKGAGKGISVQTRQSILTEYNTEDEQAKKKVVVCKYITNPLLVDNKKVDFRMYVLLHQNEIYLYKEGIGRFASEDYTNDVHSLNNPFIHITNNSINNKKMRMNPNAREGFYKNQPMMDVVGEHVTLESLYDLVRQTFLGTVYHPDKRGDIPYDNCFELFGIDILFDDQYRPYLLEVNSMPDLNGMSTNGRVVIDVDFKIKSEMLANALNIVFGSQDQGNFVRL
jgi:hypothetical protein